MIGSDGDITLIGLYETLLSQWAKKFTCSERIANFNKIQNSLIAELGEIIHGVLVFQVVAHDLWIWRDGLH